MAMATAGFSNNKTLQPGVQPQSPLKNVYNAAATEQAGNYDDIYKNYDDLLNSSKNQSQNSKLNYMPISGNAASYIQGTPYQRSNDLNTAITGLSNYSKTGGYSEGDLSNIRERGISPIRSIYQNAQDKIQRQKVLSGGYAPNLGAVTSKLNRESSSQIGDITTKINAQIAEMVANGKLNSLNSLGSLSGRENELINQNNQHNTDLENEVNRFNATEQSNTDKFNSQGQLDADKFNANNANQGFNNQLNAIQGKQSLYGTTPALTHEFANQVLQNNQQNMNAVTTANQLKNQRSNIGLQLVQNQLGRG